MWHTATRSVSQPRTTTSHHCSTRTGRHAGGLLHRFAVQPCPSLPLMSPPRGIDRPEGGKAGGMWCSTSRAAGRYRSRTESRYSTRKNPPAGVCRPPAPNSRGACVAAAWAWSRPRWRRAPPDRRRRADHRTVQNLNFEGWRHLIHLIRLIFPWLWMNCQQRQHLIRLIHLIRGVAGMRV